ncbi:reverse transcriptase family protein [Variovorax sp. 375MFSha3.1]|uniref:reverse transcriptase family protein n=1 Tax=Variovorax sp. 375MFSha3.1 TaxID=3158364 RepID=UPI003AADC1BC
MALYLNKPSYRCSPILSIRALARALGVGERDLLALAEAANSRYRKVKPEPGSNRQTFDAIGQLKVIHRRIKEVIFANVDFPTYLQGSLKGRDYVTNAALHTNKQILICEDVKKFFPSVTSTLVHDVWLGFFRFSPDVANVLTALTTKDGALPQGAITSSYIANLVMWRYEPLLHAKLAALGITYSRYVDDMAMSSATHLNKETQSWIIAQVYGMLARHGLKAGRAKHEVFSAKEPMIATKLIVNRKPSLSNKKRSQVRAQVRQLELAHEAGTDASTVLAMADKASHRVGQLGRFHSTSATHLKSRVKAVRTQLPVDNQPRITYPSRLVESHTAEALDETRAPWE